MLGWKSGAIDSPHGLARPPKCNEMKGPLKSQGANGNSSKCGNPRKVFTAQPELSPPWTFAPATPALFQKSSWNILLFHSGLCSRVDLSERRPLSMPSKTHTRAHTLHSRAVNGALQTVGT